MPRRLRDDYEGAWHHVMNRGVARGSVFNSDGDRELFLELLGQATERGAFEIHGYCLLGNHYHLLIRSLEGRMPEGMKWLAGRYTQRINYRDGRDGPLFRGRYTSVAVESDAHLVLVSRYIHLNPVEAGLVAKPEHWRWSSASSFLEGRHGPAWLRTDVVLAMFGPNAARVAYRGFLAAGIDEKTRQRYRSDTADA